MKSITEKYFYYLLFSPLIAYIIYLFGGAFINLYGLSIIIVFLIWINLKKKSNEQIFFPKYLYPLILYFLYVTFWHVFSSESILIPFLPQNLLVNHSLLTILVLIIIENSNFSQQLISKSLKIVQYTIVITLIFQIIQIFNTTFFLPDFVKSDFDFNSPTHGIYINRRNGIFRFIDQNAYGLSFLPLLSTYVMVLIRKKNNKLNQNILYLALGALISVLTNSRYIMVGYILFIFIIFSNKNIFVNRRTIFLVITFAIAASFIILNLIGYDFSIFYKTRLWEEGSIKNTTRYLAYEVFLKFYPQNWFFGNGLEQSESIRYEIAGRSSQIHVGYLKHLVTYGLVGSSLLFSFWFVFLRSLYVEAKRSGFYAGFFSMLFFLWANVTFPYYSILSYGMIFSVIVSKFYYRNNHLKEKAI